MIKDYFVIFPHAGAIRSSYAVMESQVAETYTVIYIDYSKFYDKDGACDFKSLTLGILAQIHQSFVRKNAEVVLFGHSMGAMVLQAIEREINRRYFIKGAIYSDSLDLASYKKLGLSNMNDTQLSALIKQDYDLSPEIYAQPELASFFQKRLTDDLRILENVPDYVETIPVSSPQHAIKRLFLCSDHIDDKLFTSVWHPFLLSKDAGLRFIGGDHYKILKCFGEVTHMDIRTLF